MSHPLERQSSPGLKSIFRVIFLVIGMPVIPAHAYTFDLEEAFYQHLTFKREFTFLHQIHF